MAEEELEAIQAIFCQPGEIRVVHGSDGSNEVTVRLKPATPDHTDVQPLNLNAELRLFLPSTYPAQPPDISVRSDNLSRQEITRLRTVLSKNAGENLEQAMLLELISVASEELLKMAAERGEDTRLVNSSRDALSLTGGDRQSASCTGQDGRLALLHLDHMRAKTQYVKLIKKWVADLSLNGRLLFCQRLILIVLQGPSSAVKDYIVRQRTCNVDVDSRGQPCKERMLSVLCDVPVALHHCRFADFQVVEVNSAEDLRQLFCKWCLQHEFLEHVTTLKHFPGR